jgi:hypothetical protein
VTEPVLGLQQITTTDQDGRHRVPQAVQGNVTVPGGGRQIGEPVPGAAGGQPGGVVRPG